LFPIYPIIVESWPKNKSKEVDEKMLAALIRVTEDIPG